MQDITTTMNTRTELPYATLTPPHYTSHHIALLHHPLANEL